MSAKIIQSKISKAFSKDIKSVLILSKSSDNEIVLANSLKALLQKKKKGIFVSLSKTHTLIKRMLDREGINYSGLKFVDCISMTLGEFEKDKSVTFIGGPSSLTELSISLNGITEVGGYDFIFFDSLSTLRLYNDESKSEKFMHFMLNKFSMLGLKTIIFSLDDQSSLNLVPIISQFCDLKIDA